MFFDRIGLKSLLRHNAKKRMDRYFRESPEATGIACPRCDKELLNATPGWS